MIINEGTSDILYHMTPAKSAIQILKSGNFVLMPAFSGPEKAYVEKNKLYYMSFARNKSSSYFDMFPNEPVLFVFDGRKIKQNYRIKPIDFFSGIDDGKTDTYRTDRSLGYSEMEDRLISSNNTLNVKDYVSEIHTILPQLNDLSSTIFSTFLVWKYAKKLRIPIYFYDTLKDMLMAKNPKNFDYKKYSDIIKSKIEKMPKESYRFLKPYRELLLVKTYDQLSEEAKNLLKALQNNKKIEIYKLESLISRFAKSNPTEIKNFFDLIRKNKFANFDSFFDFALLRFEDQLT